MRSLGFRSFGKSDKLEFLDVPLPVIEHPDDILVKVKAFALNQGDTIKVLGYSRMLETVTYYAPLCLTYHQRRG